MTGIPALIILVIDSLTSIPPSNLTASALENLILVYILGLPFMLYHLISSLVTFTLIGFPFYALFSQGMNNKLNVEDEITSYEQN